VQRQLKSGQGVDDHTLCLHSIDHFDQSCQGLIIDKSRERVSITPICPAFTSAFSFLLNSWLGVFSNARNHTGFAPTDAFGDKFTVANTVFPEPDGPTTSSEYPAASRRPAFHPDQAFPSRHDPLWECRDCRRKLYARLDYRTRNT